MKPFPRWFQRTRWGWEALGVFLVAATVLAWVILPLGGLLGPDGYYHFRLADVMARDGLFRAVDALPFTILGGDLPDHHLLWHWILIPFTWAQDPAQGVQWAAIVTGAMVPAGIFLFARRFAVPLPALWALLAVCAALILPGRFVMLRAQNIAILLIFASLWALLENRLRTLCALAFVFMLTYHGAVILGPLVLLFVGATWLKEGRIDLKPVLAAGAGGLLGLVLNPYFPQSFEYLYFHTVLTVPEAGVGTGGGSEWSSPSWSMLFEQAWPVHVLLLGSVSAAWLVGRRLGENILTKVSVMMLLAALLALAMYKGAHRFAEYYGPLGVLATASCVRDIFAVHPPGTRTRLFLAAFLLGLIVSQGARGLLVIDKYSEFKPEKYAEIGHVLEHEAKPGEIVFNSAYHDFPFLYFHRPELKYVIGLDTHYLSEANVLLYDEWRWIQGISPDEPNDPAPLIRAHFHSRFAVVAREHHGLAKRLLRSPHATPLLGTQWGWLFRIDLPEERDPKAQGVRAERAQSPHSKHGAKGP